VKINFRKNNLIVYNEKKDILLRNNFIKFLFYSVLLIFYTFIIITDISNLILIILSILVLIFIILILIFPGREKDFFSYVIVGIVIFSLFFITIFVTLFLAIFYVFLIIYFNIFYPTPSNFFQKIIDIIDIFIISSPFISFFFIFVKINLEKIVDFFKFPFFKHYLISKLIFFFLISLIVLLIYIYPDFYLLILGYFASIKNMFFSKFLK